MTTVDESETQVDYYVLVGIDRAGTIEEWVLSPVGLNEPNAEIVALECLKSPLNHWGKTTRWKPKHIIRENERYEVRAIVRAYSKREQKGHNRHKMRIGLGDNILRFRYGYKVLHHDQDLVLQVNTRSVEEIG